MRLYRSRSHSHSSVLVLNLLMTISFLSSSPLVCVQNGTIYQSGSAMTTSSLCSYCYCINGKQKCVKPKCQLPQAPAHCSAVYVEGSCCPLKYDCSGKGSAAAAATSVINKTPLSNTPMKWTNKPADAGLSMEEFSNLPHARKKHSCHLEGRVFVEGEKLPVQAHDPCNICYCIHGESKCTPKKCTPAMKNCVPIIPSGQCCPSGYRCNMAKPRQFDFFSILFGVDENSTDSSNGSQEQEMMTTLPPFMPLPLNPESTSEKSFLDVLRDGLNFVEKNGEHIEAVMDKSANVSTGESKKEESVAVVTVTESASDEYFDYEDNDPDDDELFNPNEEYIKVSHGQLEKNKPQKEVKVETTSTTTPKPSSSTVRTTTTTKRTTVTVTQRPTQKLEISTIKFIPSPTRIVNLATKKPIIHNQQPPKDIIKQDVPMSHNQILSNNSNPVNNSNTESLFSAFFSGLAEIFDEKFKQNVTRNNETTTTPIDLFATKPTTSERPLTIPPSTRPHFYVTPSSIRPVPIIREEVKHIPLENTKRAPVTTTTKKASTTSTRKPSTTTPRTTTTSSSTTQVRIYFT